MFQGVLASVVASCIFGSIYYLAPLLAPLTGEQIFGWRMLVTLPFTTAWLLYSGQGAAVAAIVRRVAQHWPFALMLLLSSALAGVQLWLFMWAPLHGHALPVSLGYFLLPLAMVLAGRLVFGERLSAFQTVATLLAACGMGWELWRAGGMAWSTWLVVIGYPAYFVLRRLLKTNSLAGHWLDVLLLLPVCLWFAVVDAPQGVTGWAAIVATPALHWMVPVLGVISAVALALYMAASRLLPLGLFGLMSYVEPLLLVLAALLMGERIQPGQEPMYTLIGAGVLLLALEGALQLRRRRANAQPLAQAA
ncbi:MAG: EamA family transporter RarD [Comamonas sp.]|nr:EamA family transporter RarD [Comamonas sp.]